MQSDQEAATEMLQKVHALLRPTEELSLISLQQGFEALDESTQRALQDQVDCLQVAIDMKQSKAQELDSE